MRLSFGFRSTLRDHALGEINVFYEIYVPKSESNDSLNPTTKYFDEATKELVAKW